MDTQKRITVLKARAKTEKLYLIESLQSDRAEIKQYDIMGSTGNVYTVTICNQPTCTCPYYVSRHIRCKHIYFILIRIMNVLPENEDMDEYSDSDIMTMFNSIPEVAQNLVVNNKTRDKYAAAKSGKPTAAQKSIDDLCPVCLDDLENGEELDYCKYSCGKAIHVDCYNIWSKNRKSSTCVSCRAEWTLKVDGKYINLST